MSVTMQVKNSMQTLRMQRPRIEKDSLGELEPPADVLDGINTYRSLTNFSLSSRSIATWPTFIRAFATIKQATALANREVGSLTAEQADSIFSACAEIESGKHDRHLVVGALEGSGGTSINMNVNEVIANTVASASSQELSDYSLVHPNDHVNLGQSTNDVVPTAMKLAVYGAMEGVMRTLSQLAEAFSRKSQEYQSVLRLGRTCLQDAQPMTLGQAFGGYEAVRRHAEQLEAIREQFLTVPLGGTAIGTGHNGGINEITLPPVEAGPSIMPGKVNPVIPIAVCQVALAITGNDTAIAMGCQQGMLEINHIELLVCDRLFDSIYLLTGATETFTRRCIDGIIANGDVARKHLLASSALATALVPTLGYVQVSTIVCAALAEKSHS
ncbi:hypothetical protein N8T08_005589 [Aspergillus melleus]|uniref:Uncharacterized protein n=1 Tax=Aspergillus melleus TaxID=138277 RepID=A0ACC3B2E4_9EURO|nr:hypothetical protein N8T08_005589 [Aspergillus melleus]